VNVLAGQRPVGLRARPLEAVDRVRTTAPDAFHASKAIVATDPYLPGHYPDFTIYPGIFVMETVLQAFRGVLAELRGPHLVADLTRLVSVRFTAPLLPGDVLLVDGSVRDLPDLPGTVRVTASCRRGGEQRAARVVMDLSVRQERPDARTR
jgi:3-hydroxyacyl-[acyl-carrier-protein] dehydratase